MPDLLSSLAEDESARLLENLNYLNLQEIRSFCTAHGIPYRIIAEDPGVSVKTTKDTDRKPVVLERLRRFLRTGEPGQPTCIPASIVRGDAPPPQPERGDRLYYRWYAKEHAGVLRVLGELTGGRFADGAVARVLIMEFWTHGEAPTLAEFAQAWITAKADEHNLLTPEYAYLTDLKRKQGGSDWKAKRQARAGSALEMLARVGSRSSSDKTRLIPPA